MEKQGRKLKKKFKIILVLVAILLIGIATLLGTYCYFKSPVSNDKKEVSIVIENGSTISDIAALLKKEGLIKNENFFKLYVKLKKVSNVYAAKYYFSPSMNLDEIINTLNEGGYNENEISITFKEGINMRGIAKLIKENTSNSEDDVYKKLKDEKYLNSAIEKYWFLTDDIKNSKIYYSLEGYLFPDTYYFANKDVTVREIFAKMLDKMQSVLDEYKEKIEKSDYSVHEILTLASIIEKEGKNEDFKDISSVFYNRLNKKMSLGSCATAYYGMKMDFDEIGVATSAMMNDKNDYNTYVLDKLPVGAISLPGKGAIDAAINPNDTENLYFISDNTGKTYFFKTYKEQQAKKQQLQRENKWNR